MRTGQRLRAGARIGCQCCTVMLPHRPLIVLLMLRLLMLLVGILLVLRILPVMLLRMLALLTAPAAALLMTTVVVRVDHAEVVLGVLIEILGGDPIAGSRRVARQ